MYHDLLIRLLVCKDGCNAGCCENVKTSDFDIIEHLEKLENQHVDKEVIENSEDSSEERKPEDLQTHVTSTHVPVDASIVQSSTENSKIGTLDSKTTIKDSSATKGDDGRLALDKNVRGGTQDVDKNVSSNASKMVEHSDEVNAGQQEQQQQQANVTHLPIQTTTTAAPATIEEKEVPPPPVPPPEPFRVGTAAEEMPVFLDDGPKKPSKKTSTKKKGKEEKVADEKPAIRKKASQSKESLTTQLHKEPAAGTEATTSNPPSRGSVKKQTPLRRKKSTLQQTQATDEKPSGGLLPVAEGGRQRKVKGSRVIIL